MYKYCICVLKSLTKFCLWYIIFLSGLLSEKSNNFSLKLFKAHGYEIMTDRENMEGQLHLKIYNRTGNWKCQILQEDCLYIFYWIAQAQ